MRLVYTATQKPVAVGDRVTTKSGPMVVDYFPRPHKPESEGKVSLRHPDQSPDTPSSFEYYVGVIGAEWIEREDRAERDRVPA